MYTEGLLTGWIQNIFDTVYITQNQTSKNLLLIFTWFYSTAVARNTLVWLEHLLLPVIIRISIY